ncbi:MAG: C_GCAxxG_C_C family protein [candidate division NC10 bacterium]|nr:C_GCAxxG_C_C family protein [candidate division NC10 bacterium]
MSESHANLVTKIGEAAYEYERTYHGCSQCVLRALQDHLKLGNRESYKAATALAGGIARMGETCGALMGGIMAISLAFGREELEDSSTSPGYTKAMELSMELCRRFQEAFGTTQCREIHKALFGRSFNFWDLEERKAFVKAGGYEKCPEVARRAAELATEVILSAGYEPRSEV